MPTAKQIIRKIKKQHIDPLEIVDPMDIRLAHVAETVRLGEMHEQQLEIKRQHNFEEMQRGKERQLEDIRAEKIRQELKSLKKARKVLAKMRDNA